MPEAGTTFRPNCRKAVAERDLSAVASFRLKDGKFPGCHTPVAGVWSA